MSRIHPEKHPLLCTADVDLQACFSHYVLCNTSFFILRNPYLACGKTASGYTAAINQLSFGSAPGSGPGDACGRCFAITGTADPYSPSYTGPFGSSIVVKVTDLCPVSGNQVWCGQTTSHPTNQYGAPVQYVLYLF